MKALIVGASGFIGSHVAAAFAAQGHDTWRAGRGAGAPNYRDRWIEIDFAAPRPAQWQRALAGFDVVVNAVGILRERPGQTFQDLHVAGPQALFSAAALAGVRRVVQISALGADADAIAQYHRSKREADRFLLASTLDAVVIQPSLVYGGGGSSTRLFESLATLPVIFVPGDGRQDVQPVHIDDLVDGIVRCAVAPLDARVIAAVGPEPLTLRDFLLALRSGLGLGTAPIFPVPRLFIAAAARVGDAVPALLLNRESLGMLERGNTAPVETFAQLLGRRPRPVREFVTPATRDARASSAKLAWLIPILRLSVAAIWMITGVVSLGPYPVSSSVRLLEYIGIPSALAPVALVGSAGIDLVLGMMSLWPRLPRWVWLAQICLVLVYTAIITWRLPELWLEPFGPVAKNLPILALLLLLHQLSPVRK